MPTSEELSEVIGLDSIRVLSRTSLQASLLWSQRGKSELSHKIFIELASHPRKRIGRGVTGGLYDIELDASTSVIVKATGVDRSRVFEQLFCSRIREALLDMGLHPIIFRSSDLFRGIHAESSMMLEIEKLAALLLAVLCKLDPSGRIFGSAIVQVQDTLGNEGFSQCVSFLVKLRSEGRILSKDYRPLQQCDVMLRVMGADWQAGSMDQTKPAEDFSLGFFEIKVRVRELGKVVRLEVSPGNTIGSVVESIAGALELGEEQEYALQIGNHRFGRKEYGLKLREAMMKGDEALVLELFSADLPSDHAVLALDERIYGYIVEHQGTISISQTAKDLGISAEELKTAIDRFRREGRIA